MIERANLLDLEYTLAPRGECTTMNYLFQLESEDAHEGAKAMRDNALQAAKNADLWLLAATPQPYEVRTGDIAVYGCRTAQTFTNVLWSIGIQGELPTFNANFAVIDNTVAGEITFSMIQPQNALSLHSEVRKFITAVPERLEDRMRELDEQAVPEWARID